MRLTVRLQCTGELGFNFIARGTIAIMEVVAAIHAAAPAFVASAGGVFSLSVQGGMLVLAGSVTFNSREPEPQVQIHIHLTSRPANRTLHIIQPNQD
ncbi:MAG: hypothetical protein L3J84_07415 [Gammaproteobacteria bacterium]|nr:hypothetical protein [Gammaproteobacteria bacterium]